MVFGLALVLGLVFGAASMALGANGGNFILGQNNSTTALTRLTGNVQGAAMQVITNNPGADDTALNLQVQQGEAPMRVNSAGRVVNLNADRLDGLEPSQIKGAKAYAVVDPNGGPGGTPAFDAALTNGFTSVERLGPGVSGVYCLRAPGLSPGSRPAVVSVDRASTDAPIGTGVASVDSRSLCPSPKDYLVDTKRLVVDLNQLFADNANDVGFVIAVQ